MVERKRLALGCGEGGAGGAGGPLVGAEAPGVEEDGRAVAGGHRGGR